MDLILWRHAEAVDLPLDAINHEADLERALTAKGERQAERMARWLNQRLTQSTRILVSPAKRTLQTAQALDRSFKTLPALAPGASVDDVLALARWPNNTDPVLIVGHQPTLGQVAARLLTGQDLPFAIKKAGVWWLRQRPQEDQAALQVVQSVEFL